MHEHIRIIMFFLCHTLFAVPSGELCLGTAVRFIACGDLSGFDSDKTHSSPVSAHLCYKFLRTLSNCSQLMIVQTLCGTVMHNLHVYLYVGMVTIIMDKVLKVFWEHVVCTLWAIIHTYVSTHVHVHT